MAWSLHRRVATGLQTSACSYTSRTFCSFRTIAIHAAIPNAIAIAASCVFGPCDIAGQRVFCPQLAERWCVSLPLLAGHTTTWIVLMAMSLTLTGVVAGVLAGLLGVGGGIVIVPVLYHVFTLMGVDADVRMHMAVGTSLATIVPTSIMSARAHRRRGSLDPAILRRLVPPVCVGVLIGAVLSGIASGQVLTGIFATVAMLVALNMAFKRDDFALRDGLPGRTGTSLLGAGIGGLSTLMGIGGGTLSVPILNALRVPMHVAVGTGAALGMVISLPGAIAFLINGIGVAHRPPTAVGYIDLLGMALIVPATMITTSWGARLAHAVDARMLRRLFALFLVLTSLRMFYGLLIAH